ncbi:MAG: S8 family serine peptidase [Mycobacteriales bacterium]
MRRRTALMCALAVLLPVAPHALAASRPAVKAPVVAVIDTGVRATHREFDYRGPTSTTDQFVAWWDFTSEAKHAIVLPRPGQTWDPRVRDPYDRNGHGTLTASMVGGRGASPLKTPAAAPGTKLAIAKVGRGDGTIEGSVAAAITWADRTVHADVISISIGSIAPIPADVFRAEYDAIAAARAHGVLVVVANGNGFANAGIPGDPGWANYSSSSPDVLAVGAAGPDGYLVSTDPEVTAVFTVTGPSYKDDRSYVTESGTSFATPYVAGFAAALVGAARSGGHSLTADRLEQLLKWSARDTSAPPQFEGYGVLSGTELRAALAHARAGTLPLRPSPDLNALYVEDVAGTLRTAWTSA